VYATKTTDTIVAKRDRIRIKPTNRPLSQGFPERAPSLSWRFVGGPHRITSAIWVRGMISWDQSLDKGARDGTVTPKIRQQQLLTICGATRLKILHPSSERMCDSPTEDPHPPDPHDLGATRRGTTAAQHVAHKRRDNRCGNHHTCIFLRTSL